MDSRAMDAFTDAFRLVLPCGRVALIDAADELLVANHGWCSHKRGGAEKNEERRYVHAKINGVNVSLHRFLMNPPSHLEVDHIDGDGLNNCRSNLRVVTHRENMANQGKRFGEFSSRFVGVHWHAQRRKWNAMIRREGKRIHLGLFTNEEDAAMAYDTAVLEMSPGFGMLNFPQATA